MYKRRSSQISLFEDPEMFGNLPLNPEDDWVRLAKIIPWREFELRYEKQFKSRKGQAACSARMALASLLIKERYQMSDEDVTKEIARNPYLQYFLGLDEYRYNCPFSACMLTRFRQRITPEMLAWVNDQISGRPTKEDSSDEDDHNDDKGSGAAGGGSSSEDSSANPEPENEGTLILDATCVPQNIRFPTDASLLNEARINAEEIIDILHEAGLDDGKKPRTYRVKAKNEYNSFSKSRSKSAKKVRKIKKKLLQYLRRDLVAIAKIQELHPKELAAALPPKALERLAAISVLYAQQQEMFRTNTRRIDDRIVSLAQYWVRPIKRGKQNADVEFGAKVEMSVVNGYLRVEDLRWDAFNEGTTLQASAEAYRNAYGHYPARILADTIFRTRENLAYCKAHGIHINGPKLGKRYADPAELKKQARLEWEESGERSEIERDFGVGKTRYSLGCLLTKLKHTSAVAIHISVLSMNLARRLRLLLAIFRRLLHELLDCLICGDSELRMGLA